MVAYRWEARSTTPGEYRWKDFAIAYMGGHTVHFGTAAVLGNLEQKEERRYFRRGRAALLQRVYLVSLDDTPPMPRAGEYFPGETSGPRIIHNGVDAVPVTRGEDTGLRITVTAARPACEQYVLVKDTAVDGLNPYGFYSPDGSLTGTKATQRRVDGLFYLYWDTGTDSWIIKSVVNELNYWVRNDPAIAGVYAVGGGGAAQTVKLEALASGAAETFSQNW